MIDILIPVLGRPHRAQPLVDNIRAATTVPHRIWFICTLGDDEQIAACDATGVYATDVDATGQNEYPRKINYGYWMSNAAMAEHYPFVFNASDDLEFTPGWDTTALLAMTLDKAIVATNDQANSQVRKGQFGTHCLIKREYIDRYGGSGVPGEVLHEGYDHNFVDREMCHRAQERDVYAYASGSVVKHHHPLHSAKVKMDATYEKGLAGFYKDQNLFWRRAHQWDYVGLSPAEVRAAKRLAA